MTADKELLERLRTIRDRFQRDADRYSDPVNVADAIGDVGTLMDAIALIEANARDAEPRPCAHEWYYGSCVHCEIKASEWRAALAAKGEGNG